RARRCPVTTAVDGPPDVSVQLGPSLTVAGVPVRVLVALLGSGLPFIPWAARATPEQGSRRGGTRRAPGKAATPTRRRGPLRSATGRCHHARDGSRLRAQLSGTVGSWVRRRLRSTW